MEVILLFLLCGVLVRRAEHSFREGLPGVCGVCVCVGVCGVCVCVFVCGCVWCVCVCVIVCV